MPLLDDPVINTRAVCVFVSLPLSLSELVIVLRERGRKEITSSFLNMQEREEREKEREERESKVIPFLKDEIFSNANRFCEMRMRGTSKNNAVDAIVLKCLFWTIF